MPSVIKGTQEQEVPVIVASEIVPFSFRGDDVRSVRVDGEPWFVVSDAARLLGFRDATNAARLLRPHQQGYSNLSTPSGWQRVMICNEGGINRLIMRSNAKNSELVQDWFTDEVLPEVRKTGSYGATLSLSGPELLARAVLEAHALLEAKASEMAELKPKAEFYDKVMSADGTYTLAEVAQIVGWGRNRLIEKLRRLGVLQENNLPYSRHSRHFEVVPGSYRNPYSGRSVKTLTTHVRPSGLTFIDRKLNHV